MGFMGSGLKNKMGALLASQPAASQGLMAPQRGYSPPPGLFGSRRFGTLDPTRALHNQMGQSADSGAVVGPAPVQGQPMDAAPGEGAETNRVPPRGGPFGASMRQPFDYKGTHKRLLPQHTQRPTWQKIAEVLAPALMALNGDQAGANAQIAQFAQRRRAQDQQATDADETIAKWRHDDWARQNQADLNAAAPFTIGRNRAIYDPASGQTDTIFHGNAEFEDYATAKGLEPGTPEYFAAVEDYVLRGNGPSAMGYDQQLDDSRTANRLRLEGVQHGNRMNLRRSPTYRDTNPPPRGGRTGGGAARPTATGPNGQKLVYDGKSWVSAP